MWLVDWRWVYCQKGKNSCRLPIKSLMLIGSCRHWLSLYINSNGSRYIIKHWLALVYQCAGSYTGMSGNCQGIMLLLMKH